MKILIAPILVSLTLLGSASALAAGDHAGHATGAQAGSKLGVQMVDGEVRKVDKGAGKLTLSHGPLKNLDMPAMTMVFRVKEIAWLDGLKTGDKIRFMAEDINGTITVTHLTSAR